MTTARRGSVALGIDLSITTSEAVYRGPIVLATIELPAYGANPAKTLNLSTREYVDPSGQPWEAVLLEPPSIDHGGEWMETSWQPVDLDLIVQDRRISTQGVAESFLTLLKLYEFTGARVHVQQAFDNLTSVADFATLLDGEIAEVSRINPASVQFHCVQSRKWAARPCPESKVTIADFPQAPKDSLGLVRPILFGDWQTNRSEFTYNALQFKLYHYGLARAVPQTIAVKQEDAGGDEQPSYLLSDKALHTEPTTLLLYESNLNRFAASRQALVTLGTTPSMKTLGDRRFEIAILPIEKHADTTATGWQVLTREDRDIADTSSTVTLNYDTGARVLRLNLPEVQSLGTFVEASVRMIYNLSFAGPTAFEWGVKNSATGLKNTTTFSGSSNGQGEITLTTNTVLVPTDDVEHPPDGWSDLKNCSLYAEVKNSLDLCFIRGFAIDVTYRPHSRVVRPGTTRQIAGTQYPWNVGGRKVDQWAGRAGRSVPNVPASSQTSADVTAFDFRMHFWGKGTKDDGSGTYSGTANALLEHPADIVHYLLRTYGAMTAAEVTTALGDFGSFVTARTNLASYKMLAHLTADASIQDVVETIGNESLTWFFRRATLPGSPWVAIPWDTTAGVNYRDATNLYTFSNDASDVEERSFQVSRTRISQQVNNVRVNFDWDPKTNGYARQVYITDTTSRVYSGGAYTTDAGRVTSALASFGRYGRRETSLNLKYVTDPATASAILTRFFDLRIEPRVVVNFSTWMNAFDLERGHVIQLSSDWNTYMTYPKPGSDGSWASKKFRVIRVQRAADQPTRYRVAAVEV